MEVSFSEMSIVFESKLRQELEHLRNRGQSHDLLPESPHDPHREVKNKELIALKEKKLPKLIKKRKVNNPSVKCHHPLRCVHFDDDFPLLEMLQELLILVAQKQVKEMQATLEVRQDLAAAVELGVKVVRDV